MGRGQPGAVSRGARLRDRHRATQARRRRDPLADLPHAATGALAVNVKDAPYSAAGDGTTDDTAAIQAALDATPDGGTCYLPPGSYLLGDAAPDLLRPPDGVTVAGAGPDLTTLVLDRASTAARVIDVSGRRGVTVRDLTFDGAGHATVLSAVFASTRNTQKDLRVRGCRFLEFMPGRTAATQAAIYTWTSDGVVVEDNEFVDCGRAVTVDQPDGQVRVTGNRITAASDVMATGILVRRSSGASESKVLVDANYVSGADRDPSGVGTEGHAIAVYRVRDVHVTNNHCLASRRGILVSAESFGALVQGNTCAACSDAGIRVEPEITAQDTTVGRAVPRGVSVIGNVCRDNAAIGAVGNANSGKGITMSYAAGSSVVGNTCHDNTGDGIFCDSDRVAILGNICFSNFRATPGRRRPVSAPASGSTPAPAAPWSATSASTTGTTPPRTSGCRCRRRTGGTWCTATRSPATPVVRSPVRTGSATGSSGCRRWSASRTRARRTA